MANRRQGMPPGFQNPFEQSGLDKQLVEALLQSGDESLTVALTGLRRTVTRALHPDTHGLQQSSDYLDSFLQSTARLNAMSESERRTLATAYVKKRGGARVPKEKVEYESKDLHDGTLLRSIIDMTVDSQGSIPSSRDKQLLVRPLDFSTKKPTDVLSRVGFDWYPPDSARTYLLQVSNQGKVAARVLRQTSLNYVLKREHGSSWSQELYNQERDKKTQPFKKLLDPLLNDGSLKKVGEDKVWFEKRGQLGAVYNSLGKVCLGDITVSDESLFGVDNGIYSFGLRDSGRQLGVMEDSMYIYEDEAGASPIDELIVGSFGKDFIDLQRGIIYEEPRKAEQLLQATRRRSGLHSFAVPEKMYREAQKSYSPLVPVDGYLAMVNDDSQLQIVGKTIASLSE